MLYDQKPDDINSWLEVSACFIEHNEEILLIRRPSTHKFPDTWIEPGGKIDSGENTEDAMIREVFEESGVIIKQGVAKNMGKKYFYFDDTHISITFFHCKFKNKPKISLSPKEADSYIWITPRNALELNLIDDLYEIINTYFLNK